MPVLLVIPARVGSTRLPSKPLLPLGGVPLIVRVLQCATRVPGIDQIVIATDSTAVADVVLAATPAATVVQTASYHESGTDRVAEVARLPQFSGFDVVVNLQGDEPFMPAEAIAGAVAQVAQRGHPIGTAASPMNASDRHDPARVKVVCDRSGRALYFSRSAIPHLRDEADAAQARWWQHLGVYAYTPTALQEVTALPPALLERTERLEQLRAMHAGFPIGVALLDGAAASGIDTPDDLAAAEVRWRELAESTS